MRFLPDAERHGTYFHETIGASLIHARRLVADVSARLAFSLIYQDSNTGDGASRTLFITLVEWGIIPIVCRCRLCIQEDERLIRGYALFLSHLLVDVHPNLTDWIHVPREQVNIVDFSRILNAAQEVYEVLGCNRSSTVVLNLQLACRCGHPSYQGPLTFAQLVRIIGIPYLYFLSFVLHI